jgi:manganese/zinc/iron transport system permease protein
MIRREARLGNLWKRADDEIELTDEGLDEAARVTRNHRLWEMYLVTHADIAPSHVDRDADMVEHVLDAALVQRLETALREDGVGVPQPRSLHPMSAEG